MNPNLDIHSQLFNCYPKNISHISPSCIGVDLKGRKRDHNSLLSFVTKNNENLFELKIGENYDVCSNQKNLKIVEDVNFVNLNSAQNCN